MPDELRHKPEKNDQIEATGAERLASLRQKVNRLVARSKDLEISQQAEEFTKVERAKNTLSGTRRSVQSRQESAKSKGVQAASDHEKIARQRKKQEKVATEIRETATMLDTANLVDLSAHDAERVTDQMVRLEVNAADVVQVETASSHGYETHDFLTLAQMAARLGRPVTENGRPLLSVLSRPETKHFLATLAALQRAFNSASTPVPVAYFSELDTPDLKALVNGFSSHLKTVRPNFLSSNSYKWGDLVAEAANYFKTANERRLSIGTQLFRKLRGFG